MRDESKNWRIMYRLDDDAIVVAEVFSKTTRETPKSVIDNCKRRSKKFDSDSEEQDNGQSKA